MGLLAAGAGAAEGLDKVLERALLQQKFAEQIRAAKAEEALRARALDATALQRGDALAETAAYHRALAQDREDRQKASATDRLDKQFNEMPSDGSQPFDATQAAAFRTGGIIPGRMRPIGIPQVPAAAVGVPAALAAVDEPAEVPGTIANSPAPGQVQFTRAPSVADLKLKQEQDRKDAAEARAQTKTDADIDAKIRQLDQAAKNAQTAGELTAAKIALAEAQAERARRPASAGAAKPSTGAEKTALGFYTRAKEADETITAPVAGGDSLEDQMGTASHVAQFQLQRAPNLLQTSAQQAYRQAQRAFTEAKLRKESGAAISQSEYENDARVYFAQPGDSPAVRAQKRKMRQTVLSGLKFSAGKAYQEYYGEPDTAPSGGTGGGSGASPKRTRYDMNGNIIP